MADTDNIDLKTSHQKFSVLFFNQAWDLLDQPNRGKFETEKMIHLAHASLCHWMAREDCSNQNLSIGTWQISRVYAMAGEASNAMKYAEICLKYSQEKEIEPVFLGYAYEAMARAARMMGNEAEVDKFIRSAKDIADKLDSVDAQQLQADLSSI